MVFFNTIDIVRLWKNELYERKENSIWKVNFQQLQDDVELSLNIFHTFF